MKLPQRTPDAVSHDRGEAWTIDRIGPNDLGQRLSIHPRERHPPNGIVTARAECTSLARPAGHHTRPPREVEPSEHFRFMKRSEMVHTLHGHPLSGCPTAEKNGGARALPRERLEDEARGSGSKRALRQLRWQ
jgi:hypothetical protein